MKRASNLWRVVLALAFVVLLAYRPEWPVWGEHLVPAPRGRRYCNPRRNRERWARRLARQERQRPQASRRERRRRRVQWMRALLNAAPVERTGALPRAPSVPPLPPPVAAPSRTAKAAPPVPAAETPPDPLADLRTMRGWVDQVNEREVWAMLIRVRWPHGPVCPRCGERDPRYLTPVEPDYRGGLGRWRCEVCAQAGDAGECSTFTALTGTILEGTHLDIRTLWLIIEAFADGKASVETADEARVHRHSTDRLFRLLRAAIYQSRSDENLVSLDDIAECDEVYITAGLKGCAGGLALEREPRQRGLKRRGRGDWESDRLPVFGMVCRGGQVRLFVLPNVQSETIRPLVHRLVERGARVYTDSYAIYNFLSRDGYQHRAVNHGAGEYALDLDGDGRCEVHCNTMECTWSWLRQMVRTYRGVSKVYLPLYVAQFEFFFNRRQQSRWNRTLDVLQAAFQLDAASATKLLRQVEGAQFAEVCPVVD